MNSNTLRRTLVAACTFCALTALGGCPQNQILGGLFALDIDPAPLPPAVESDPTDNTAPTISVGDDLSGSTGDEIVLNAAATSDPDGDRMLFWWVQTAGSPTVDLKNRFSAIARFDAPALDAPTTFTFRLTVIDGVVAVTEDLSVVISPD